MSRSFDSTSLTTLLSIAMVPPLISSSPASMRNSVDLPQPEGPTNTMNSPSLMSKLTPWITLVVPKFFSTFWKDTEAINPSPQNLCVERCSTFHSPSRKPADHIALERIVDRRRRRSVNETRRHQQLPWRIVGSEKVAQGDGQGDLLVVRQQQERIQVLVPREQQGVGANGDQRGHHQRQIYQSKELQRRCAVDLGRLVKLIRKLVGRLLEHPDGVWRGDGNHRQDQRPLVVE